MWRSCRKASTGTAALEAKPTHPAHLPQSMLSLQASAPGAPDTTSLGDCVQRLLQHHPKESRCTQHAWAHLAVCQATSSPSTGLTPSRFCAVQLAGACSVPSNYLTWHTRDRRAVGVAPKARHRSCGCAGSCHPLRAAACAASAHDLDAHGARHGRCSPAAVPRDGQGLDALQARGSRLSYSTSVVQQQGTPCSCYTAVNRLSGILRPAGRVGVEPGRP